MRLLLCDDDAFLRDMYATKFIEAGHDVVSAKSGEQALETLRKDSTFDAVVFDMVMPGMTGLELLKAIKAEKVGGEKLRCIILSNRGEQSDISEAKEAGADGYLVKAESIPSAVVTKVTQILSQ